MQRFQRMCTNSSGAGAPLQADGNQLSCWSLACAIPSPCRESKMLAGCKSVKKIIVLLQQKVPGVWKVEGD